MYFFPIQEVKTLGFACESNYNVHTYCVLCYKQVPLDKMYTLWFTENDEGLYISVL